MSLPAPNLDDRTFQDLVNEAKRLIPRYCPEWTDHNVSDPGVTLIELFAYMVDLLLYRVNRVPERNYIKWLELLGIKLAPPIPARVDLTFTLSAPQPAPVTIPIGTQVATVRTETIDPTLFATEQDLTINPPHLIACLVSRRPNVYHNYMIALRNPDLNIGIFQDPPQPNDSIYFGYEEDLASHLLQLNLTISGGGVGIDPNDPPRDWEYWNPLTPPQGAWENLIIERDSTRGFNRSGDILLHVPYGAGRCVLDGQDAFWIKARVAPPRRDQPAYATSPRISAVTTNAIGGTVVSSQVERIGGEVLGRSDGKAGREWTLLSPPIMPRRPGETLEVETHDGTFEPWIEVDSFGGSGPDDPHFTLDSVTGVIRFGPTVRNANGREVQYGRVPPPGRLLRFTGYRTGGGTVGNVGRDTITMLKSSIPYVAKVTNRAGATGGADVETLEVAKMRAPYLLRNRTRAVTAEDFEFLTLEASPEVFRCRCLPPCADDEAAGRPVVRIAVVPRVAQQDEPVPRQDLLRLPDRLRAEIMSYLNERRLLTTQVELTAPGYTWVSVEIRARPRKRADPDEVRAAIERRLYRYINPVFGGAEGTGRHFDEPLYLSEIYALLQGVEGVEFIETIKLFTVNPTTGERTAAEQSIAPPEGGLLASDTHLVTVQ